MKQNNRLSKPLLLLSLLLLLLLGSACSQSPETPSNTDCGNGVVDKGEKCDTKGKGGGQCPTVDSCKALGGACSTYELAGKACQAHCVEVSTVTTCIDDDGCCPQGCQGQDSDCDAGPDPCFDSNVSGGEVCDNGLSATDPKSCAKQRSDCEAKTVDACHPYKFEGVACRETCVQSSPITSCIDDDGCCPNGCKGFDNDCEVIVNNLGGACQHGDDCGADGFCKVQTRDDQFRGGYCTGDCSNATCPQGSTCNQVGAEKLCLKNCTDSTDCRSPNYECNQGASGQKVCEPVRVVCTGPGDCTTGQTCEEVSGTKHCVERGSGTNGLGEVCARVSDCSGGEDARCLPIPRTSHSICTKECDPDVADACGTGFACVKMQRSETSYCFKTCNDSSECNTAATELTCREVGESTKVCTQIYEPVGGPCTEGSQCLSQYCLTETSSLLPGGYCSALCNRNYACPKGSTCIIEKFGTKYETRLCKANCTDDNSCRNGYKCYDVENLPSKICDKK